MDKVNGGRIPSLHTHTHTHTAIDYQMSVGLRASTPVVVYKVGRRG